MGFDFSIFDGMAPSDKMRELKELLLELKQNRNENYDDIKTAEVLLKSAEEELYALEKKEEELEDLVEELEEPEKEEPLEELVKDVETPQEREEDKRAYDTGQDAYSAEELYKETVKDAYSKNKTETAYQKQEDKTREAYQREEPMQKTASEELKDESDPFKAYKP